MATGLLEVRGTIDLAQFWPTGESDADTTKVLLSVGPDAFRLAPGAGTSNCAGARTSSSWTTAPSSQATPWPTGR